MFEGVEFAWGIVVLGRGFIADVDDLTGEVVFTTEPDLALLFGNRQHCSAMVRWACDKFPGSGVGLRPFAVIQGKGGVQ